MGLHKAKIITIENAGHNLFMCSPRVSEVIQTLMRDEELFVSSIGRRFL